MATNSAIIIGTTQYHVYTSFHVGRGIVQPAVATAFANDVEIVEDGEPVEFVGTTEDEASDKMRQYLEDRFGEGQPA